MLRGSLLACVMLALALSVAQAGMTTNFAFDGTSLNDIRFQNYEMILRDPYASDHTGSTGDVVELPDGPTFNVIDPFVNAGTAIRPGDLVMQVFRGETLYVGGINVGAPVNNGFLSAYVIAIVDTNGDVVPLEDGATDPFGVITPDGKLMTRWFLDEGPLVASYDLTQDVSLGGALQRIVNEWTDGTPLFDFGFGTAQDGSGFEGGEFHVDYNANRARFEARLGLNVLDLYGLDIQFLDSDGPVVLDEGPYSLQLEQQVKHPGTGDLLYSATPQANKTPFLLASWDPVYFVATPEPGSALAIVGMAAVGLLIGFRRRRK